MKITWFGGGTFRLYVGGRIVVTDPRDAPAGVEAAELTAAADEVVALAGGASGLPQLDPDAFPARRRLRPLDEPDAAEARLFALGGVGLAIDDPGEAPLILAPGGVPAWGPFADEAVVVLFGDAAAVADGAGTLLSTARPRLVALAAEGMSDARFAALAATAGRTPMQVLEAGLAVEA